YVAAESTSCAEPKLWPISWAIVRGPHPAVAETEYPLSELAVAAYRLPPASHAMPQLPSPAASGRSIATRSAPSVLRKARTSRPSDITPPVMVYNASWLKLSAG